uniref:Uncharacterized protein n=1 Tax=Setaria italica TaxID=4555 RepID=K3Z236_SETIT
MQFSNFPTNRVTAVRARPAETSLRSKRESSIAMAASSTTEAALMDS